MAALGLLGTLAAIGQAWCAGFLLQAALAVSAGPDPLWLLAGFAALAVLRAGLGVASERVAFEAGATARRRLRTDALTRLLAAGPALLRTRHSGGTGQRRGRSHRGAGRAVRPLAAGGRARRGGAGAGRWLPSPGPTRWAALVLAGCGLLVPVAMALSGIGAAVAVAPPVRRRWPTCRPASSTGCAASPPS